MPVEVASPVSYDEIKEKLGQSLDFLETMTGVEIPRKVEDAMTLEWLERAATFAEGIVEHVSEEELKAAKQRVIPIDKANTILRSIENQAVHLFVQSSQSEIVTAVCSPFAWMEWIIGNEGKILILLAEIAGRVTNVIRGDFLEKSLDQWEIRDKQLMSFNFGAFWRQLAEQNAINEQLITDVIEATAKTVERALAEIAWEQVGPIVEAFAASAILAKSFKPILQTRKEALQSVSKAPLPQRSKGRWRRRKASRRA